MSNILLNCDLGEYSSGNDFSSDAQIMSLIDQANIACGFHAADPLVMSRTIALAKQHGVSIGAHPSYSDRENFGRLEQSLDKASLQAILTYQIGAFSEICKLHDVVVDYVKPHGALYNQMMKEVDLLQWILELMQVIVPDKALMLLSLPDNSENIALAQQYEVPLLFEAFADRAYDNEGFLVPRSQANAVYTEPDMIVEQLSLIRDKRQVRTVSGKIIDIQADTVCVHGDNPAVLDALLKQNN